MTSCHSTSHRLSLLVIVTLLITACGRVVAESPTTIVQEDQPRAPAPFETDPGLAFVLPGGAQLHNGPIGSVTGTAQEGLVFPIIAAETGWYEVLTTCGREAWVTDDSVETTQRAIPAAPVGQGFDLSQAVIVVDAGHGGRDQGANGANGTGESHVNLEIAELLRARLESSSSIDWDTGAITTGSDYPAVRRVWLTRPADGPEEGDVEVSLAYRAEMSNRAGADVLVSVHNNTSPETTGSTPGTDAFYSVGSSGSDRLASLIHEEMVRSLAPLGSEWSSGMVSGPKARVDPDSGDDFYGLLRRSEAPAVIVEGLYISDADEEAILNSTEGHQTYADAVYRGIVRFLTSSDIGSEILDPEPFSSDVGSTTYESCVVPKQSGS